jgi:membrane protease YdiL (CAAX protease family)
MSQLCDKDKGILSRMKTLHVYLLCLVVLFIFYIAQVRIVDGYLCFDDPGGIYAVFLIALSIFILFISLAKTPQVKIPPLNRPKDKLVIDLILIIGLSFICSGWVVSFAGRIHPIPLYGRICNYSYTLY